MKADAHPHWAVIGDPVDHSLSPRLFLWLLSHLGVDGTYRKQHVTAEGLDAFVKTVRAGGLDGCNVTLPHKETILPLLDDVTEAARSVGAVNTVARRGRQLVGTNTDVDGVVAALASHADRLQGKRAVVLGAGGAARAGVVACDQLGLSDVVVVNRTLARAEQLVHDLAGNCGAALSAAVLDDTVAHAITDAALVLQCSSVGLDGTSSILDDVRARFEADTIVMDMVYRPLRTPFLQAAESDGAIVVDGLWMLVHQALAAYAFWTGDDVPLDAAAPLRAHLVGHLHAPQADDEDANVILRGRQRINAVDRELLHLLAVRAEVARSIGALKAKLNEPVVRPEREARLRKLHLEWAAELGVSDEVTQRVFDAVLDESRRIQQELQQKD